MILARRLESAQPSPTLALNAKAKALAAAGVDVVGFAAGEPDFDTPQFIKDAAVAALAKGQTKYTATAGTPELRSAIAEKLRKENDLQYAPEQILASCGAKHSLYNTFQALLNEGDEVIIFAPYWVSYPEMVMLAGGKPVIVQTREEDGYAPDPAALKKALTPKTKAVIINSPSNPTGAVLTAENLKGIADAVRDHTCFIVTDDIYERLLYVPGPFKNILNVAPELKERTVVVNGFSKAFSMTGWRLGYAAGPKALIAGMQLIQDQSTSNPSSITQAAGVAALHGPGNGQDPVAEMVKEFKARRDLFVAALNQLPGVKCSTPGGAFYLMPNLKALVGKRFNGQPLEGSIQISSLLLEQFKLAAVPGQPFGAEGYVRLSFATSRATIEKGLARLKDFVGQLT